ncbi:MAG: inositol monophosphatase family protein [Desulfobacterales bacterium]
MSNPDHFIEIFGLAARQAGFVARHLQNGISLGSKKNQKSPEAEALTAVDLAAQDVILTLLHHAFPDAAVDAEEETDTVGLFNTRGPGKPLIVVDPIDGTLNYSRGSSEYAVMAGWLEHEVYRAVLVHFPAMAATYWAIREGGARQRTGDTDGPVSIGPVPKRVRVTPRVPGTCRRILQDIGFEIVVSRCSAVDATAPVSEDAAAAVSLGRPERRRAVGFLITAEAGGVVRIGERWWKGEDPLTLPADAAFTIVAENRETAERISAALKGK